MKIARASWFATFALVSVAAVWGVSFVLTKPAIAEQPFLDFLATRFTLATLLMIVIRPRTLQHLNSPMLRRGAILGVILGLAFITQTIAIDLTTAAITGFLTGLYVVLTPMFARLFFRQPIRPQVWVGAILAIIGLGLISITGFRVEPGQLWGIACAVLFAAHFVGLGQWSPGLDSYTLTVVQLGMMTLVLWAGALIDGYQPPPTPFVWGAVVFTAILGTSLAFLVQTWAQSRLEASRVAVILTLEVVFTALFSVGIGQEVLLPKTILGGAIIVLAMLVVEWPSRRRDSTATV